jgi:hypothetical protein
MSLFAFVMDWQGGTYISQVEGETVKGATLCWARALDPKGIPGFGKRSKEVLIVDLEAETPVEIDGTVSVWCVTALVRGHLALVNVMRLLI